MEVSIAEALAVAGRHLQAGELDLAEAIYRDGLQVEACHATCLRALGLVAFRRGQFARAIDLIELALVSEPDNAEAHAHLAAALQNDSRADEAVAEFEKALALNPDDPETHRNLGLTLRGLRRFEEAAAQQRRALELKPNYFEAHSGLAVVLLDQGKTEEAIATLRRCVALRPEDPEAHNNLGVVLMAQGRAEEAVARYEHALALKPDYADAQMNYGAALAQQGRDEEALARFRRAVAVQPDHVDAILKLAAALGTELELDQSLALLRRAIELKPELGYARVALCISQLPIIYRDEGEIAERRAAYRECLVALRDAYEADRLPGNLADAVATTQPFYLAYQGHNDRELQGIYGGLMCRAIADHYPAAPLPRPPAAGEKVRVGIVAGLFRHHTVWKLMVRGWLTQLDRRRFEVFGYHTAEPQDEFTGMARQLCHRFVQGPLPAERWREEILADAPHILIYPDIGMDPGAGHLAAHRLAPVQCMSWGHPNTSGYPTIDYFLSSELMEPPDGDEHYSEILIRLPNLSIYYEPLAVKSVTVDRAGLGLRPGATAYWSGQSLFKYLPQYDDVYARIARDVPAAQFLFIEFITGRRVTELMRGRLDRAFAKYGLSASEHCIFLPRLPTEVFVAAIGQCDVVLDTPAWSGGNTTLEGINHGVPIVTWPGPLMRGRHTAAILRRIGVGETIAETIDDYVTIAVRLARDAEWRAALRRRIDESKYLIYCDQECIAALSNFLWRAAHGEAVGGSSSVAEPRDALVLGAAG